MQTRHQDRSAYFEETATSCRNYYLPYIEQHTSLKFGRKCRVMEVGCGIGGILSIFAAMGATVTGIDIHKPSIETAKTLFAERGLKGTFICFRLQRHTTLRPDYPTRCVGAYSRKGAVDVAFKILSES